MSNLNLTANAINLLNSRYLIKDENQNVIEKPEEMFLRVAKHIASAEIDADLRMRCTDNFYEMMSNLEFIPNSPAMMNSGKKNAQVFACLSGDTIIRCCAGDYTIKELSEGKLGEKFDVYSNDGNRLVIGKAFNARKTKLNAPVYKITFDNNSSIKTTNDHLIMMRDGSYKRTDELKINDSIMPFNCDYKNNYLIVFADIDKNAMSAAKFVYREKTGLNAPLNSALHHKDYKKSNNDFTNLELFIDKKDHIRFHYTKMKIFNPMFNSETADKISRQMMGNQRAKGVIRNTETRKKMSDNHNRTIESRLKLSLALKGKPKSEEHKRKLSESLKGHKASLETKQKLSLLGKENNVITHIKFMKQRIENLHNHKVVSIELVGHEDVYDLSVEKYHNFAANGIFVHNCFCLPVGDSIEEIFESVKRTAIIHKTGGGTGFSFSHLRPEGSLVKSTGGTSSGPISFMGLFNAATMVVKQGGVRRGANMGVMEVYHPDIEKFIKAKKSKGILEYFNISVSVDDRFMKAVVDKENKLEINGLIIHPVDIFKEMCKYAWKNGEPGVLFLDAINRNNPYERIECTNPCISGESFIHTTRGKIKIKELVGKDPWVFCSDGLNVRLRQAKDIRITGSKKEVWKLISHADKNWRNHELIATPDHKIMMIDGSYKMLKDLKKEDSIMPFYQFKKNSKGYRQLIDNGRYVGEAQFVLEQKIGRQLVKGEMAHHIDNDKTNNDPWNLVLMDFCEHSRIKMLGDKNPIHKITEEGRNPFQQKGFVTKHNIETWKDPEIRKKRIDGIKIALKNKYAGHNHKVKSIEFFGYEDVYNMEIEDYHNYAVEGIITHNCGEVPLLPYESCVLGSINLALMVLPDGNIDYERIKRIARLGVRFLDNCITINCYPFPEIEAVTKKNRKIGLGVMGFADMLIRMEVRYGSERSYDIAEEIMSCIQKTALTTTMELADEKGSCALKGLRNSTRITVAPTGSISILADCSSSIEPLISLAYQRRVDGQNEKFDCLDKNFKEALEIMGVDVDKAVKYALTHASIKHADFIPKEIKDLFVIANEIKVEDHVEMQARFQKFTDNAVSKTVNMPHSATVEDVENAYIKAWQKGCKGITVYRNNSRAGAPIVTAKDGKLKVKECTSDRCEM